MFHARPNLVRPSEVSAKVQNRRPITQSRPGKLLPAVGHARHDRARPNRRAGKRLAAAQLISRTTADASVRAGKHVPRPAEISSAKFHRPTTPADHASVRPRPFRLGHNPIVRPIVPHDRPNAAVDPKPFLKPKLMFSSPA
ncbi:unnamed protein product [Microthlaspi erraticum]|uniref:Uncharacterized protein n=1 Tax=Microthlaspi erraticum TaxID=1685480 RepID=A0A6D2I385_9BRAS|nr:unnamed protein product [Microthlaspi erraticum]